MFFGKGQASAFSGIFSLPSAAEAQAALEALPGAVKVTFDDFSWEERTHYAWLLAAATRHSHSAAIAHILDDYLYLLARLPGKALASWAPLRAQAAGYGRQAAEQAFDAAAESGPAGTVKLAELAARLKTAGLETGFDPDPERAAALALRLGAAAIADPSPARLAPLLSLLQAARDLGSGELIFHLQNCLMDLFSAAHDRPLKGEAAALLRRLYEGSGIIIERFNARLEEMALNK